MLGSYHYVNKPPAESSHPYLRQTFCQCRGKTFVSWWSSIVNFTKQQLKLKKQLKKASKISICKSERWACQNCHYKTVRLWCDWASVHLHFPWGPCMAFRGSSTSPVLLGQDPPSLRPKSPWEVGGLRKTISGTSGQAQVDRRSLYERTVVTTIVTGSSPRLADQYITGILVLLLELINGLAKANDWTSFRYKLLPSALTKHLLQICGWQFSGRFVRLMTWTQHFSRVLFFRECVRKDKWHSLLDVL